MLKPIEQKVLNYINDYRLLPAGEKVLLAVSGGADSVALLKILLNLKSANKISNNFHIAHINHQLRGQSSIDDAEFVKSLATEHNLSVAIEKIDVKKYAKENKLSIETAARILRLEKLAEIAQKNNCSLIASAHQKNDNAETLIHRLLRGTGFKGLAGIRPKAIYNNSVFVRPLLRISRDEIETYLSTQNIKWQTDHTNFDYRFTRNRIRHRLLPHLQEQSSENIIELLFLLSKKFLNFAEKIEKIAEEKWIECVTKKNENTILADLEKFNSYPSFIKLEIIQKALKHCGIGLQKITNEHYDKMFKFLLNSQKGKKLQLPQNGFIEILNSQFRISNFKSHSLADKPLPVQLQIPGRTGFDNWIIDTKILSADQIDIDEICKNKNNFIQWFDADKIELPLVARCRQNGDKFQPFGHNLPKKIGKFIISAKNHQLTQRQEVIISDYRDIIWLAPIRRSSKAKITAKTLSLLKIEIKK